MTEYARNNIVGIVKAMTSEEKQLVLLETMLRYGIIARITCKLR